MSMEIKTNVFFFEYICATGTETTEGISQCRLSAHILAAAPTGRVRAGRTDGCVRECARRIEGPAAHA